MNFKDIVRNTQAKKVAEEAEQIHEYEEYTDENGVTWNDEGDSSAGHTNWGRGKQSWSRYSPRTSRTQKAGDKFTDKNGRKWERYKKADGTLGVKPLKEEIDQLEESLEAHADSALHGYKKQKTVKGTVTSIRYTHPKTNHVVDIDHDSSDPEWVRWAHGKKSAKSDKVKFYSSGNDPISGAKRKIKPLKEEAVDSMDGVFGLKKDFEQLNEYEECTDEKGVTKITFSQFNHLVKSDLEQLSEEQLSEIFGFFKTLSLDAKKKEEEKLKKRIALTQARINAKKNILNKKSPSTQMPKSSELSDTDPKLPVSTSSRGQGMGRAAERELTSFA